MRWSLGPCHLWTPSPCSQDRSQFPSLKLHEPLTESHGLDYFFLCAQKYFPLNNLKVVRISGRKHLRNKVSTSWIFFFLNHSEIDASVCLEIKCLIIPLLFANFIQRETLILSTSLPRKRRIYVNDLYLIRSICFKR